MITNGFLLWGESGAAHWSVCSTDGSDIGVTKIILKSSLSGEFTVRFSAETTSDGFPSILQATIKKIKIEESLEVASLKDHPVDKNVTLKKGPNGSV